MEGGIPTKLLFFSLVICISLPSITSAYLSSDRCKNVSLSVGYYKYYTPCTNAEEIVKGAVEDALKYNIGFGAGLIRMHFHDCFVRGCDASVLLDSTPGNVAEKDNVANFPSLRGFEVIDEAKRRLDNTTGCKDVVSCADIIAFAARDAAAILGNITYQIPSGRCDGNVSHSSEVLQFLPAPFHDVATVVGLFVKKGFTLNETVILSGAHSIGVSNCTSINRANPLMNGTFAQKLNAECKVGNENVNQDIVTPNALDSQYYSNVQQGNALFNSDLALMTNRTTRAIVNESAKKPKSWKLKFAAAMVKMGELRGVGAGEIRRKCNVINSAN